MEDWRQSAWIQGKNIMHGKCCKEQKNAELEQLIHDVFCYDVMGKILGVEDGKQEYKSYFLSAWSRIE